MDQMRFLCRIYGLKPILTKCNKKRKIDIDRNQLKALLIMYFINKPQTISEIAKRLPTDPDYCFLAVRALLKYNLAELGPPGPKGGKRYQITPDGASLLKEIDDKLKWNRPPTAWKRGSKLPTYKPRTK
jgi:hypothetical protein